jgi:hypothetical protein
MITAKIRIPSQIVTDTDFEKEFPELVANVLILSQENFNPDKEDFGLQALLRVTGSLTLEESLFEFKEVSIFRDSTNTAQIVTPFFSDELTFENVVLEF